MKLVIPIFYGTAIYTDCNITTPSGEVIADSRKLFDQDKPFSAMLHFIHGCTESLTDSDGNTTEDRGKMKDILRELPQKTAEHLSIQIMLEFDSDDGVEGVYACPRCGTQKVCELEDGIDTRDFISELEINYLEDAENRLSVTWEKAFEITDRKGELLQQPVKDLDLRFITLGDCIQAYARYGSHEKTRMQYFLYANAILAVNNAPVDDKWRRQWGMYIFEKNRNIKEINKIARKMNYYGLQPIVTKHCNKCGKEWEEYLNTANFFASALRSEDDN